MRTISLKTSQKEPPPRFEQTVCLFRCIFVQTQSQQVTQKTTKQKRIAQSFTAFPKKKQKINKHKNITHKTNIKSAGNVWHNSKSI